MDLRAQRLRDKLATAPKPVFVAYAAAAAFATYFCMYAYRKPFAAAQFEGQQFLGGGHEAAQLVQFQSGFLSVSIRRCRLRRLYHFFV